VRLPAAPRAAAIACVLVAIACGQPVPPPVAVREPSLEAEDLAVIRALFDDFFRPALSKTVRASGIAPRFLVVDTTMAMCRRDPDVLGPQPGRCLSHDHANILSKVVSAEMFPSVKLRFPSWNAAAVSITGSIGDDVTLVSPTLLDMTPLGELLRGYPLGSTVVWLSSPGYPAPGTAVLVFGNWSLGAARLERHPEGRWRVTSSVWRSQDQSYRDRPGSDDPGL